MDIGAVNVVVKDGKRTLLLEFLVVLGFLCFLGFFERPVTKG